MDPAPVETDPLSSPVPNKPTRPPRVRRRRGKERTETEQTATTTMALPIRPKPPIETSWRVPNAADAPSEHPIPLAEPKRKRRTRAQMLEAAAERAMLQDREAADGPGERPVPPAEPKHKRRTRAQMREAAVAAKAAELQDTTPKTEATDSEHKLAPSTLQSPIHKLPMSLKADRNEHPQPPAILPVPSAAYLQQTLIPSTTLSNPRPLLIILDLNGALIYRAFRSAPKTFTSRPFVPQFLAACLSAYYVLIWSSARPENVRRIVQGLLPEVELRALQERRPGRHLLGIWGRDTLGLTAWEYNNKVQVYKRLETVWGDRFIDAPRGLGDEELIPRWDQSNTVLVDDSDVKASAQPYNLIQVSAFAGEPEPEDNSVLSQVLGYVEALNCQSDVSSFMRERPFKMKAQQVDSKVPVA